MAARETGFRLSRLETFSCGGQTHEMALYLHETTKLEFVLIPAGTFVMGSHLGEPAHDYAVGPPHRVTLTGAFLLCRTECTQAAYRAVSGESPSQWSGDQLPVEQVSWDEASAFCDATELRLPTEAEWEYACRAGSTGRWCFGDDEGQLSEYAWYTANSAEERTHPVGQLEPNAFGLHDMHGNVWEFCEDSWHSDYLGAPSDGSVWKIDAPSVRMTRGGGCSYGAQRARSVSRVPVGPHRRLNCIGLRPARSVATH